MKTFFAAKQVLTIGLFLFLAAGACEAGATPFWQTTMNCTDWKQGTSLNCDGMGVYNANAYPCPSGSFISSSVGNPSGSGKGWRQYVQDGYDLSTASPYFDLGSTGYADLYVRFYMRWQLGFAWSGGTLGFMKLLYASLGNGILIEFYGSKVSVNPGGGSVAGYINYGWNDLMGGATGDGKWHEMEFHIKNNGGNDLVEMWTDGVFRGSLSGINIHGNTAGILKWRVNQNAPANGGCAYNDIADMALSTSGPIGPITATTTATRPNPPTLLNAN